MTGVLEVVAPARLGPRFRYLLGASWLGYAGDGLAVAAGPLLVASLTHNALLIASGATLQWLPPLLFGLWAGALSDRLDRRRLVFATNLVRIAVLGVTFKPDSDDVRDSPALDVDNRLYTAGADHCPTCGHSRSNVMTWVMIGYLGQAVFTARFLAQWLASEKKRDSVVPVVFWWLSLAGGFLLLNYAIHRQDQVIIVGQSMGVFIYIRNLMLVSKGRKRAARKARHQASMWA